MATSYKYNRSRKPLTLREAQLRITDAVKQIEEIIFTCESVSQKVQAAYALSNLIDKYCKLFEKVELLERIEALEGRHEQQAA